MNRHYKVYTSVNFMHDYYADGLCGDFVVQPTSETAARLPKYRLLWGSVNKKRTHKYELLREQIDAVTPLLPLPAQFLLRFEMYMTKPEFVNFTSDVSHRSREIFVFENQLDGHSLMGPNFRKMELVNTVFQVNNLPIAANVLVTPADGSTPWLVAAHDEEGSRMARVGLDGKPSGIYMLTWPGGTQEIYHDPTLYGKGIFGVLHLAVTPGLGIDIADNTYTLSFKARAAKWKYFLMLNRPPHTGSVYQILNANPGNNGAFNFVAYPQVSWDPVQDPDPAQLVAMSHGAEILAFISDTDIPYRDAARSSIKLDRSVTFPRVVANDLPNPALGAANAAVFVSVENPAP